MPAWLMSDNSASISALPGSWRSSWVTYSCTCCFCLRSSDRLTAWPSLARKLSFRPGSRLRSASSASAALDTSSTQPSTSASRPAPSQDSALGSSGHWPGSFGLRPENCDCARVSALVTSMFIGRVVFTMVLSFCRARGSCRLARRGATCRRARRGRRLTRLLDRHPQRELEQPALLARAGRGGLRHRPDLDQFHAVEPG